MYEWLYTDLDSLWDTRLATYLQMDESYPERVIKYGYATRIYDRFDAYGVSWDEWRARYLKRDKETMVLAMMTHIPALIKATIIDKEQQAMTAPLLQPNLIINTAPYQLDETEVEVIKNLMIDVLHTGDGFKIEFVHRPIEKVTPAWLHESKIFDMFATNGEDWLAYHLEYGTLNDDTCRDITLHIPALVTQIAKDPRFVMKRGLPLYKDIMSPFINMSFVKADFFCAVMDDQQADTSPPTD